jgi:lysozyme
MPKRKTKKSSLKVFLLIVAALAAIAVLCLAKIIIDKNELRNEKEAYYNAFGIDMPVNYNIHGIDVSSHQKAISWPLVQKMKINSVQMGFVFIKASEGLNDTDKQFKTNWLQAKNSGMICGAYHFFLATKSGALQAKNFIGFVNLTKGNLPPVVDIEELYGVPPTIMRKRLKECLDSLEVYYHVKPIIYSYADFYENYLGKDFDDYPLWVAHYLEPEKPRIKRDWSFWQHSNEGHINGITTPVDCNVFNGDSLAFRELLIK